MHSYVMCDRSSKTAIVAVNASESLLTDLDKTVIIYNAVHVYRSVKIMILTS